MTATQDYRTIAMAQAKQKVWQDSSIIRELLEMLMEEAKIDPQSVHISFVTRSLSWSKNIGIDVKVDYETVVTKEHLEALRDLLIEQVGESILYTHMGFRHTENRNCVVSGILLYDFELL